jgi:hypothetical protein
MNKQLIVKDYVSYVTLTNIIRGIGIIILFLGLWIGLKIVNTSWSLFEDDTVIDNLAKKIESRSHIDSTISSLFKARNDNNSNELPKVSDIKESEKTNQLAEPVTTKQKYSSLDSLKNFQPSYFLAWLVGVILLILVGHISALAITTGAKLCFIVQPSKNYLQREDLKEILEQLLNKQ